MRFIKLLPVSVHRKLQLLQSLAFSMVFWCAGVASPCKADLDAIRNEALAIFRHNFTFEVPYFLMHAVMGWATDPQFLLDFAALRRAAKFVTHRPSWLEDVPLSESLDSWSSLPGWP